MYKVVDLIKQQDLCVTTNTAGSKQHHDRGKGQRRVRDTGAIDVESARESLEYPLQGREMHLPCLRKELNFRG